MKKILAALSTCMIIGFAVALANAEDTMDSSTSKESRTSTTTTTDSSMNRDQGSAMESGKSADSTASRDTMRSDHWKDAKTCTDSSGVTYSRGKKGFSACVDQMRKSERKEQMGGMSGSDTSRSGSMDSMAPTTEASPGMGSGTGYDNSATR